MVSLRASPSGAPHCVESCRRRGTDPLAYLRDVLARLPKILITEVAHITPEAWAKELAFVITYARRNNSSTPENYPTDFGIEDQSNISKAQMVRLESRYPGCFRLFGDYNAHLIF